jgi:uncharacterized membrane protein
MAEVTQKGRRTRGNGGTGSASGRRFSREQAEEQLEERQDEVTGDEQQDEEDRTSGRGAPTLTSELRDTIRAAAIEVLRPVAQQATKSAAKYAVTKGPDVVKDRVMPKIADAGGAGAMAGGLAKGAVSKAGGVGNMVGGVTEKLGGKKGGDKKPTGHGRGRRLPVQEYVDVAVDLETAYDQFTQFEEFPRFMHRVERIEQRDDQTLMWHENIWGVRRSWEAEIVEQKPCERIVWRSKSGPQNVGVVTFHKLSDHLTRIYVNLDFQPKGLFEKSASGMRMSRRALRSDLMRFKAFVEMKNEATGAWRGMIEDGEVVDQEDEGREDEGREDEEPRGEGEEDEFEEGEEGEEEEPEARGEDEEEYEDEDEDYEEEEEEPKRGRARGAAEEDEEPAEEEEEPAEEPPAPRRRRSGTSSSGGRRRSTSASGRSRS